MTFPILTYLQSFRADPRLGAMLVPIIIPDSTSPDGFAIRQEVLSNENCSAFLETASFVVEQAAHFRTHPLGAVIPHTEGAWTARPGKLSIDFSTEGATIYLTLDPKDRHLAITGATDMSVVFPSNRERTVVEVSSYSIFIFGEAMMDLRTFLGLPSGARIDHIGLALRRFLGFTGDLVIDFDPHQESLEGEEISTHYEIEDHLAGRKFVLSGGFESGLLEQERFHEEITLNIYPESSRSAPLTEEALRLWDWVTGLRGFDRDVDAYHQFTARLYSKVLPGA